MVIIPFPNPCVIPTSKATSGPQGFGSKAFYVAQIPCKDARAVIIANHYSRRVVNNSYIHLGIFRDGAFVGVMQFGYTLCPARARKVVEGTAQDSGQSGGKP